MKLLFISNSFPFPPKTGIEVVNAHLIKEFQKYFNVDFLLVTDDGKSVEQLSSMQLAGGIEVIFVPENGEGAARKVWEELMLVRPSYFSRGTAREQLNKIQGRSYDWAWCGDVSSLGFVSFAKALGHLRSAKVAVGINEAASVVYRATLREVLLGKRKFSFSSIVRGMRAPLIRMHEKKYLGCTQLVHVQTNVEKLRVENILGHDTLSNSLVVSAPMGKNEGLQKVTYAGGDGSILYFAQLSGERANESEWFLKKVWPGILKRHPQARLKIVGARATTVRGGIPMAGVELCGYIENLADIYQHASVVVVPTFRGTGIITRVLDAITAGSPLVSTREALGTIDGLEVGVHAMAARTADDFISTISLLLSDRELRMKLSRQAHDLAGRLPTWDESAQRIVTALYSYAPEH